MCPRTPRLCRRLKNRLAAQKSRMKKKRKVSLCSALPARRVPLVRSAGPVHLLARRNGGVPHTVFCAKRPPHAALLRRCSCKSCGSRCRTCRSGSAAAGTRLVGHWPRSAACDDAPRSHTRLAPLAVAARQFQIWHGGGCCIVICGVRCWSGRRTLIDNLEANAQHLHVSVKLYKQLADECYDMISLHACDAYSTFLYCSKAFQSFLGWDPAELVGQSAYSFYHMARAVAAEWSPDGLAAEPAPKRVIAAAALVAVRACPLRCHFVGGAVISLPHYPAGRDRSRALCPCPHALQWRHPVR